MIKEQLLQRVEKILKRIYTTEYQKSYRTEFEKLIEKWESINWQANDAITEKNIYLITYGDSIYEEGKPTLPTLHKFLNEQIGKTITDVHLLPMFPYTSDDGFSVTDYRQINPELGDWGHIENFSKDYRLMFDFVVNHTSKSSAWFQGYLSGDEKYQDYFVPRDPAFDSSKVIRPRTSPLFHDYETKEGVKSAWTTFSEDQVDINIRHLPVLLETTDILIEYAMKGGTSIRLDAIGFLWKESGTSCMHLTQTHGIIQLWRLILDYFKPNTQIITETNVPHQENISYFGDGTNEAQMVYQFSLPPLVLFTLTTHNSDKISKWAKTIEKVSDTATYFNFLASHDGVGMRPTEGILTEDEQQLLVDKVLENGGRISYKKNTDGNQSVYEMNINYSDALINKEEDFTEESQIKKMLAAHAILLSVIGVPAIYYHSLFGSQNDYQGLEESGINRRINREKLDYHQITKELQENYRRKVIFKNLQRMITARTGEAAFSPYASQEVLNLGEKVFALKRDNKGECIYFIVNVDCHPVTIEAPIVGIDLMKNQAISETVTLAPYEFLWIKP